MKFFASKDALLPALMAVNGIVEKKQTMPVLSNLHFYAHDNHLTITATDLDIEMQTRCLVDVQQPGSITLPARKLVDICRNLAEGVNIEIQTLDDHTALLKAGRGRYKLQTLPADEFPNLDGVEYQFEFTIPQYILHRLISRTQFSMALQDVRYFLNGLLLEVSNQQLRAVATDAHRLALADAVTTFHIPNNTAQFILPRKAVQDLARLFPDTESLIQCRFGRNHVTFSQSELTFTTKLIDSKYANYEKAIPDTEYCKYQVTLDRVSMQKILTRVSILSQEKIKGVSLVFSNNLLTVQSYNNDNEEAEESLDISYSGEPFTLTFNAAYVVDFLNTSQADAISFYTSSQNSSTLIKDQDAADHLYVVMPMKF